MFPLVRRYLQRPISTFSTGRRISIKSAMGLDLTQDHRFLKTESKGEYGRTAILGNLDKARTSLPIFPSLVERET